MITIMRASVVLLLPVMVASVGSCTNLQHDVGFGGIDLDASYVDASLNITRCCAACDAIAACDGWTLNAAQGQCWLKSLVELAQSKGQVSGLKERAACVSSTGRPCPNILYLMSDDMRPQLNCYGQKYMITPQLDKLAATGLQFDFAYTQFAFCAPSRNSIFSGRRPDRNRALNFLSTFRKAPGGKDWVAMPQFFKTHGYFTSSAGKLYHDGMDDPPSWTYPSNQTRWVGCQEGDYMDPNGHNRDGQPFHNYCGVTDKSKVSYTDEEMVVEEGLRRMDLAVASGKPWWVSIGVHRPHVPYRVPQGFHGPELYPEGVVLPPKHPNMPTGAPYMSGDFEGGDIHDLAGGGGESHGVGCPTCVIPDNRSVEYRRWYYAAVTWADHAFGRALTKLDELGVANSTMVIFHSDHGYQLGELNEWSKKTNTELAVHVPLLIRAPWKTASLGQRTTVKADIVDIYRTLAELAGLSGVQDSVQGMSLAAAFDTPRELPPVLADKVAFSQIGRCSCGVYGSNQTHKGNATMCGANCCIFTPQGDPKYNFMGYTMRTTAWRFTAWVHWDHDSKRADWSRPVAPELFDLSLDTGRDFDFDGYSLNLATQPKHATTVASLQAQLKAAVLSWDDGLHFWDDDVLV